MSRRSFTESDAIADGTSLKVTLAGQLRELQYWVYAMPAIVAVAVGLHIWLRVVTPWGPVLDREVIASYGNYGAAVANGQWWRSFCGMWLHINDLHLAGNMLTLAVIGRSVERMVGWRGFLLMYLLSGLGGALATNLVLPYAVSIGASGAVYGVFGCVVGFTVRYPGQFPSQGLRTLMWAGLAYLGYSVAFGTQPGINWVAHAGGFATGMFCGVVLTAPLEPHALPGRRWRDLRLALGGSTAVAAVLFGIAGTVPHFRTAVSELVDRNAEIGERAEALLSGDAAEIAGAVDREILPALHESRLYAAAATDLPPQQLQFVLELDAYLEVRERAWRELTAGLAMLDLDAAETGYALHSDADTAQQRLFRELHLRGHEFTAPPAPLAPAVDRVVQALVAQHSGAL